MCVITSALSAYMGADLWAQLWVLVCICKMEYVDAIKYIHSENSGYNVKEVEYVHYMY